MYKMLAEMRSKEQLPSQTHGPVYSRDEYQLV